MTGRRKVMGLLDVTLFTVSAMLVIDQLTASASVGTGTLAWWLLAIVFFLVPYGLITSELATAYPEQGGIYVWVKRAFGRRWAARTTYWYWVNVALWMPSVFLLFAGVFAFGLMALLYLVTEELLVEAHEAPDKPWITAMFFAGFLLLILLEEITPT